MLTRHLVLGCAGLFLSCSALAQQHATTPGTSGGHARPQNTFDVLNQMIPDVSFQDTPFDQVISWLQDLTKLNITTRWQILKDAGVAEDKPITLSAHNLPLTQVLWLIMNEAGGTDLKLAYRAAGRLLILSTADDLNKEMITKVYDVADLLINVPQAVNTPMFDVTQGMGQNGGGVGGAGGGMAGGMFQQGSQMQGQQGGYGSTNGTTDQEANPKLDKLVNLIRDTIEPDSWRENGGSGTISPYQKLIVVRNTLLVHQRLGGYITEEDVGGAQ